MEFDWDEYLRRSNSSPTPDTSFPHVEESLRSRIEAGMTVEVPVLTDNSQMWIGVVRLVSGPLVSISYIGQETDSSAKWLDTRHQGVYKLGWARRNNKILKPPDPVLALLPPDTNCDNWDQLASQFLDNRRGTATVREDLPPGSGQCVVDCLVPGTKLELQDSHDPALFWGVTVRSNRGGLLGLSYDSPELKPRTDFHMFYLDERLRPCGTVAASDGRLKFSVPAFLAVTGYPDQVWKTVQQAGQESARTRAAPSWVFPHWRNVDHGFEEKMLLTAVDPRDGVTFRVAIVDACVEDDSFGISLLEDPSVRIVCTAMSNIIVPINWAIDKGFLDKASLAELSCSPLSKIAGSKLFVGMNRAVTGLFKVGEKLEVVEEGEGCIGTVEEVRSHMVKVVKMSRSGEKTCWVSCRSLSLFPAGWCQSHGVELFVPDNVSAVAAGEEVAEAAEETGGGDKGGEAADGGQTLQLTKPIVQCSYWCPAIYFNHLCYSSSFISKARLAWLPKQLGPGPVRLVIRAVLSRLIGSSFKSGAVLKKLEVGETRRSGYWLETMKGKSRVMQLQAEVEVPTVVSQVAGFCREVCQKLECCPYLFGPLLVGDACPSACTTRPKSEFQLEDNNRGRGAKMRRRKGKKRRFTPQTSGAVFKIMDQAGNANDSESSDDTSPSRQGSETRETTRDNTPDRTQAKRKNIHKNWGEILPPSEIRTRGAKLPNFALQLKVRPSRKDLEEMERIIAEKTVDRVPSPRLLRSRSALAALQTPPTDTKTVNKPQVLTSAFEYIEPEDVSSPPGDPPAVRKVVLSSNPVAWSPADVAEYLSEQPDVAGLARHFLLEEIDGQAFMLLNFPTVQEHWNLCLSTAIRLCQHIEAVKLAYYIQFAGIVRRDFGIKRNGGQYTLLGMD